MITANELKKRGVSVIKEQLENYDEVGITVRNKVKYVVMPVEKFDQLREMELDMALLEVEKDIEDGNYKIESVEEHMKRVWND